MKMHEKNDEEEIASQTQCKVIHTDIIVKTPASISNHHGLAFSQPLHMHYVVVERMLEHAAAGAARCSVATAVGLFLSGCEVGAFQGEFEFFLCKGGVGFVCGEAADAVCRCGAGAEGVGTAAAADGGGSSACCGVVRGMAGEADCVG